MKRRIALASFLGTIAIVVAGLAWLGLFRGLPDSLGLVRPCSGDLEAAARRGFQLWIADVDLQPDGGIVALVGMRRPSRNIFLSSPPVFTKLVRYHADGTPDGAFGANQRCVDASAVFVEPGGALRVGTRGVRLEGGRARLHLEHLGADGTRDAESVSRGTPTPTGGYEGLLFAPGGGLYLVGGFMHRDTSTRAERLGLLRLSANGSLDAGFAPLRLRPRDRTFGTPYPGAAPADTLLPDDVFSPVLRPDGGLLLVASRGGEYPHPRRGGLPVRLGPDGAVDSAFAARIAFTWRADSLPPAVALAVQPDGRIVVALGPPWLEEWKKPPPPRLPSVVRLNADGTLDRTFGLGFRVGPVQAVWVQPDGGILALPGDASHVPGVPVRLLADGSPDPFWARNTEQFGEMGFAHVRARGDGSVLLASVAGGVPRFNRLRPDGAMAPGFAGNGQLEPGATRGQATVFGGTP